MHITNKHYPYPVLKPYGDDYIESLFDVTVVPNLTSDKVILKINAKLKNKKIKELIDQKLAKIVCHIESSLTAFRKTICIPLNDIEDEIYSGELSFEISSDIISGKVFVCPFIISSGNFDYANPAFNPEYGGVSFPIDEGAVLAEGNQISFEIPNIRKTLEYTPSIFETVPIDDPSIDSITVDYSHDEKIIIHMPKEMFKNYKLLNNSLETRPQLWAMIIVPCMVHLLEYIQSLRGTEDYSNIKETRWYNVINDALKKSKGYDLESADFLRDDIVMVSEDILKNPLQISLCSLTGGDNQKSTEFLEEL